LDKINKHYYLMKEKLRYVISLLAILVSVLFVNGQSSDLKKWPAGSSPQEIGKRIAEHFLVSPHGVYGGDAKPHIPYFEVCTWYGALTFAKETGDKQLADNLAIRFEPLFDKDSALLPIPDHVDYTVFGTVPLELYMHIKDQKYLELGKYYADKQWAAPFGPRVVPESFKLYNGGFTWQTRLWIDDMYMITIVQAQAYRATGDKKYIDRAAREMIVYLDSLQKPNGLFYHAPDAPFFWGRGNGWMAAGMTELLRALPQDNPNRPRIMDAYKKMMASLLSYQMKSGMWRQLIDDGEAWPETSCSGMFTFAMITGVKNGWLDKRIYGEAARKAWLALISYINENAEITDVCEGTGKKNDHQYYLDRKRLTGDMHGQTPILWCATALLRKEEK
jgi:unsaturated rhamnogalacturonyl hydrolase